MLVEIWSDIACPWCYVGKRRFGAALARFEHRDALTVAWRSFELHAVPCFVIDRRIGATGARAPEDLVAFLRTGWEQHGAGVASGP
jgi:predicted DsbA family dithiol-disulfide isomerase